MNNLSIPYLQVRSNTLYQYNQSENTGRFTRIMQAELAKNIAWLKDEDGNIIKRPTYSGVLSPGAKKRLTKAIEYMVMASPLKTIQNPVNGKNQPFQLSFITLTVYSTDRNISGKEAHKTMLEPFLQWMRRKHKCLLYLWKAELQKRGQIHYHLTSDVFIHHKEVREKWNSLQKKAGYLESFYSKFKHYNAPSTEIKSVKKVRNIGGYLIKEIAKGFQNEASLGGKIWDCSQNLKACKYYTTLADSSYNDKINQMIGRKEIEQVMSGSEHCRIFRLLNKPAHTILNDTDKLEYSLVMKAIRTNELETIKPERRSARNKVARPIQITIGKLCNTVPYGNFVRCVSEYNNLNFNLKNHGNADKAKKAKISTNEKFDAGGLLQVPKERQNRMELCLFCQKWSGKIPYPRVLSYGKQQNGRSKSDPEICNRSKELNLVNNFDFFQGMRSTNYSEFKENYEILKNKN
jgi:hypothetical protein